ncbi:signal recognition particle protein Srp19, partial [archaeon]|nr:signal recognition particle protein Srp19 [archaeon]
TGAKIKFVGVGEKKEDLESFNPKGFVGRMLGMGDLDALLEKANVAIDEDQAQGLQKRMLSGKFNLLDLYEQMSAMKKMGSLSKLMEMVPGMGQLKISKNQMNVQEEKLKKWKFMLDSMTKQELEDPAVISTSRIERITNGSGTDQTTLRELLKQFRQSKKMLKMLKGGDPQKMMKKFQKSLPQGM